MRHLALILMLVAAPAVGAPPPTGIDPVQAQVDASSEAYKAFAARHAAGAATSEEVHLWSVRWFQAEQDGGTPGAAAAHRQRMLALADAIAKQVDGGILPATDKIAARYYLAEADRWAR